MKIMGVDLGTRKVAYSIWEDGILTGTEAMESKAGTRHAQLMEIGDFMYDVAHHVEPDFMIIEDVLMGNNRKYSLQLAEVKGAILAQMGLISHEQLLSVFMVNVQTWKKEVLASGHATKDDVQLWLRAQDTAYSDLCGYDQDKFDAAAIGYYGVMLEARTTALMEDIR